MIISVELKNWKTHKATKLNFTKGTNVLIGLMGAGKSSVMDAISYGLFGNFPAIQHKRVSISDLITNRPNQENVASVKIAFDVNGNVYTVTRSITTQGDSKATLEKNGAYLQSQPQRVNEELTKILKVDYDLFSRAIYSEQNQLNYFLDLSNSERKKQIDELLGLDKFALAQENTTSLMNRLKDLIDDREKIVANLDIEKIKGELKSFNAELDSLKENKAKLEKLFAKIDIEAKDVESRLRKLKGEYARKTVLAKEIAELKSKMDFINSEIEKIGKDKLPAKADLENEMKALSKQISGIREREQDSREEERSQSKKLGEIDALVKQIKSKIAERDGLQKELGNKDLEKEEKLLKECLEHIHSLERKLAACESEKEESRKWAEELQKHLSKCPVCERELDDQMRKRLIEGKNSILENSEKSIRILEKEIKERKLSIDKKAEDLDRIRLANSRLKDYVGLDAQLKKGISDEEILRKSYEKLKEKVEELRKESDMINKKIAELSSKKEKSERLENYREKAGELDSKFKSKSAEIKGIDVDEGTVEKVQKAFTEISSSKASISSDLQAHDRYLSEKQRQIDQKREQMTTIEKMLGDVNKKKLANESLMKFKNALEETQTIMRSKLISSINDVMQSVWPEIYPYNDYVGIKLDAKANDYVLMVKTSNNGNENWERVQAIASGGEKSIACLAMRVAFSLVLVPNLKWIILDEPTHNIDEQGIDKFIKVFNETLPRIIDQIFIITHDEALKQAASSKTYLLTRNKGENGPTVVQEQ